MKLPNSQNCIVAREKITDYLLLSTHEEGGSKSDFFHSFGFYLGRWEQFAEALSIHGREHEVVQVIESEYGVKYVLEGSILTPDGRNPDVRTVWQIDYGADHPRLIAAVPFN